MGLDTPRSKGGTQQTSHIRHWCAEVVLGSVSVGMWVHRPSLEIWGRRLLHLVHAGKVKQAQSMMHELAQQYSLNAAIASQAPHATQSQLGLSEQQQQLFTSDLGALIDTERKALESLRSTQRSAQQAAQQAVSDAKSKLDNFQSDLEAQQALLRACTGGGPPDDLLPSHVTSFCIVAVHRSMATFDIIMHTVPRIIPLVSQRGLSRTELLHDFKRTLH